MTSDDLFGCCVTLADKTSLVPWNKTLLGFLAHSASTAEHLGKTIELEPDFALAHACRGLFNMLLARRELYDVARKAHDKALECNKANPVSERELRFIEALGHWLNGKPSSAIKAMEQNLAKWPNDALAMKMSQAIRFMLGDGPGMRRSLERISEAYKEDHPASGYLKGCYAFALEEAGEYRLAETTGRQGLELAPNDAWGLHAVAHVYDMTAKPKDGLLWLTGKEQAWEHCNNFRYHVWWHIALMHLDLGNFDQVLALYDKKIRSDKTDDYRDIANGTSVLMRLEFEGVDVGSRWEELAELAANRTDDNCLAFADLHYLMALCSTDNQNTAAMLIGNMEQCHSHRNECEMSAIISHPGLAAAHGLEAFRDQNFEGAYHSLSKARPDLHLVGGSHAQRDVFERLAIESAIRAGLGPQARNLLRERDLHRGHRDGYSENRWALLDGNRPQSSIAQDGDLAATDVA